MSVCLLYHFVGDIKCFVWVLYCEMCLLYQKCVRSPGSARTRCMGEAYNAFPDLLAGLALVLRASTFTHACCTWGKKNRCLLRKRQICVFSTANLRESIAAISKTIISKTTDNRKWQYGYPNRKYLYLRKYNRYHQNSNGKFEVFDLGELEQSISIAIPIITDNRK